MTDKPDAVTKTEPTEVTPKQNSDDSYTTDDLIELVRAVKFAHTDMSMRKVHEEISGTMANSDPSYAFLKDVTADGKVPTEIPEKQENYQGGCMLEFRPNKDDK